MPPGSSFECLIEQRARLLELPELNATKRRINFG